MQSERTVESFGWQWTRQRVTESKRSFYRKLFTSRGVWHDFYDGKIVADVGSGVGRFTWALAEMTKAKKIISVELSGDAVQRQREYLKDPRIEIIQADVAEVKFQADVIYAAGFIQHSADPLKTLQNLIGNLNEGGELLITFYMRTVMTTALEPLRFVLKRLPKRLLWNLTPFLAPLFMVRREGRKAGFRMARHTAYDWFGSHEYQHYSTDRRIREYFARCGIHENNILVISKGMYRVRKTMITLQLDDMPINF